LSDKPKFPAKIARAVGEKIVEALKPVCARIEIAGSLRRGKDLVGDVEIVYVPKFTEVKNPLSLFGDMMRVSAADLIIQELIERGSLSKRPKPTSVGATTGEVFTWGEWIKLAVAVKTGVPIDLFATTNEDWFNTLVCRTGSKETNAAICKAAQARGWQWHPSPSNGGFLEVLPDGGRGRLKRVGSEREVFEFAGLNFLPPEQR
jgi:DNA polymerase/3'-5' exonuclease PolX